MKEKFGGSAFGRKKFSCCLFLCFNLFLGRTFFLFLCCPEGFANVREFFFYYHTLRNEYCIDIEIRRVRTKWVISTANSLLLWILSLRLRNILIKRREISLWVETLLPLECKTGKLTCCLMIILALIWIK
jgi:hypothetical protein